MSKRSLDIFQGRPVLSTFGKGIPSSRSLNYGTSGGPNCASACPHFRTDCYAIRVEKFRAKTLLPKLQRHETIPAHALTEQAFTEVLLGLIGRYPLDWFRFSSAGSVPNRIGKKFAKSLDKLLDALRAGKVPVHFPVETKAKADRYRARFGHLATIRESATSVRRFLKADDAVSIVAGRRDMSRALRLMYSRDLARERTAQSGRRCIVCPAVAVHFAGKSSAKAKCGICTACAKDDTDIVYPRH